MSSPILIRPLRVGVYAVALVVAWLAGVYLGGPLLVVWYAMLLLPLLSLAQAFVTRIALRYHQEFENDHPAKGEVVGFHLSVTNESPLPSSPIVASFHLGRSERGTDTQAFQLKARETHTADQAIRCPYRGIYTVGLSRFAVWDLFGWIGFTLPVFSRTFYVYPRVVPLPGALAGFGTEHAVAQTPAGGIEIDLTLYRSLRRYRPEEDARHISWRKLAATGEPMVREYDTAAEPAVTICLDTRPVAADRETALGVEDGVIEIMIALTKHYLDREVPVSLVIGGSLTLLDPTDSTGFARLHSQTIGFFFRSTVSPAVVYDYHRGDAGLAEGTVIFVTHTLDPGVVELVEQSDGRSLQAAAVVDIAALPREERQRGEMLQRSLRDRGGEILLVESVDTLAQELAQWHAPSSA